MSREYKLDKTSYEKFRSASHENVNRLLTNVYREGYDAGLKKNSDASVIKEEDSRFTEKHADMVCKVIRDNKIKGVGEQTLKKIENLVKSLVLV